MPNKAIIPQASRGQSVDIFVSIGLGAVMLFFIGSGFLSYWNTRTLNIGAEQVARTHEITLAVEKLVSLTKDAETGQRGFILTGDEKYLEPYTAAIGQIDEKINSVENRTAEYPALRDRISLLRTHIHAKLAELAETINLRRTKGFDAALAVVLTDRGKNEMDAVRTQILSIQQEASDIREQRLAEMGDAYHVAIISGIISGLLGLLLTIAIAYLMRRAASSRRKQQWLQMGQVGLSQSMLGEQKINELGENILKFLAEYFGAHAATLYVKVGDLFKRTATYGLATNAETPVQIGMGEGLLGQAVKDRRPFFVHNVPDGYITVASSLGKGNPRHLMVSPAMADGDVNAVVEFGFLHPLDPLAIELLNSLSNAIGIAIQSAHYRANLQDFLEETQRQSEELQTQSEELRVANEELEEQSRILKESQARLEQQQIEQEQTNAQLEEQTQILESQRDDLARTKSIVQSKAEELERASQYKSDFLANMSHELRTPLNSSLIMAKLLADNLQGNLTEEQIKFAKTIQASGNDLLLLINDILDLSKIEAGHMEVHAESVWIERLAKDLRQMFEPVAVQKGLALNVTITPNCPQSIETDRQRLEQILKNLLSNAMKFTEKGHVDLNISQNENKFIVFDVVDSGIGIPEEQQQAIFEAFRQADGTISRKYGGTGLGLSISRELTRLLGGSIGLVSNPGHGSTFTILMPEIYDSTLVSGRAAISATIEPVRELTKSVPDILAPPPIRAAAKKSAKRFRRSNDDRDKLSGTDRVILVVEDDESFARLLYDMTHELEFSCIIATTAEEAVTVAQQYLPNAIILDVGLPDHSGLSVLDRLKHDGRTRHIPVHIVSAGDYAQTALSLGAAGYMLKPVSRDRLMEALKKLEARFTKQLRRVLIVEDDPVQRESVSKLLQSQEVEPITVGTAAECLEKLKDTTFDCMVLDLSLPDASGYSLLETLSQEDAYSFPPVIVYTGHDLSIDEEQRLRRYSKSIIIKGAKSPERLLDEVTLFLHQVVADLPPEQQKMLERARNRDSVFEHRRILIVEDDIRNVYALTSIFEPRGAIIQIARNGREALDALEKSKNGQTANIDLVLMDVMMPEMDGLTATREIRKIPEWKRLPIIVLTAKAMKDDQERCLEAGANDYMAKPLDVEKLLSLVRVWMPR